MGAIKPPWISKQEFYRLPFNFCDRWCERCRLTGICKVYKDGQRDRRRAIREGKDPDSLEFAFEVMHKNFQKTMKLLNQGAKKWGIDMKKIMEESKDDKLEDDRSYEKDPLYQFAEKLSVSLSKFLKNLEVVPIDTKAEAVVEAAELISWYHALIVAKTARALSSEDREKNLPEDWCSFDDRTSAFIAFNSLQKIAEACGIISRQKPLFYLKKKCYKLAQASITLSEALDNRFDLASNQKYHN